MSKSKNITLKDIAKEVGISINSVSKALKNHKSISEYTKKKVVEVANKLGYVPDNSAKGLRSGKLKVIAIIYDNFTNPYYSMMLNKTSKILYENEYESMIFVDRHSIGFLSLELAKKAISYRVSGIISFIEPLDEAKKCIEISKIPFVLVGRSGKKTNSNSVSGDDYQGGALAAKKLLELNGKEFLYFTEHSALSIDKLRYEGFKDTLINSKIDQNKIHKLSDFGNIGVNVKEEFTKLLDSNDKIDSIFCFSDLLAFELLQIISENYGSRKINVIGYDNIQSSFPYPIRISSVSPDEDESIKEAIDIIFSELKNGIGDKKYLIIPVTFHEGTTTKLL